jgi:hypothetical protein
MQGKGKHYLPSIAQFLFLALFLHLSLHAGNQLLNDADTGFHIRAGEYMLETRSIPGSDPFSMASPPLPWPTHEWLSDVVMAVIHRAAGLTGIVLFFAFLISLAYSLLFRVMRGFHGNILLDLIIVMMVIVSSGMHWLARPHVFSWLLLILWYFLLDSYQYRRKNALVLLPVTMLLWVNLHGSFLLGFVLLAIYLASNVIEGALAAGTERAECRERARWLFLATAVSLLVLLANPKGTKVFLFPYEMMSNRLALDNIQEWMSPDFHQAVPFKYLLLLMIAFFAISGLRLNLIELSLILLVSNMSLHSARFIPLFGIIVSPVLSRQGESLLRRWHGKGKEIFAARANSITSMDAAARGYLWPVAVVAIVAVFASTGRIRFSFDERSKPVAAVEFLKKERLEGPMFNSPEFGDYVVYSASSRYKVFFDGREEIYGKERIRDYLDVVQLKPGWEKIFDKYGVQWVFFPSNSALSGLLLSRKEWRAVYSDAVANVLVKNIPEHSDIIRRYSREKPFPGGEEKDARIR